VLSDMDQPLGLMVGNFLEVREAVDCLRGGGPRDLLDLVIRLTAHMLVLGGIETDLSSGEAECRSRLADGSAWRKFVENVALQGGEVTAVEEPDKGPRASLVVPVASGRGGYVERVDAYKIGLAAGLLGAGRDKKEDSVLPEVGIELKKIQGDEIEKGEALCLLHARDAQSAAAARELVEEAYALSGERTPPRGRVLEEIDGDDLE
jgi:pyrimidine-nucleoside phosphorylase